MSKPPIGETIRAKLEEYDVERRVGELATQAEALVGQGMARAGAFTREHRHDLDRFLDRASDEIARRTDGRHADHVDQVRRSIERGADRLAEHDDQGDR